MKKLGNIVEHYFILEVILWAFCLNIIIELLSRDTPMNLVNHMISYPMYFTYNLLILILCLSISAFFKKKRIALMLISAGWFALGVGNYIVLSYRITPFAAIDLSIMEWDLDFLESYLDVKLVLAVIVAIVVAIGMLVLAFKRAKASPVYWKKSFITTGALLLSVWGIHGVFVSTGIYEARISNMQESYDKFGFVSCFTRSATERGIDKPEEYSEELMEVVTSSLSTTTESEELKPNIIVVQLESFFDPELLEDTEFSENPIPYFTQLSEENSSGSLEVAVVGAGTANTEFEVLTSMTVDYFGTGEYPYETILHKETCESVAYNLKNLGYTTFAMHNNTGTFYERYLVYPNLGFDAFVSSEFMADTTTTPQGWIKDECLTPEIAKCLESTEGQDFVFAVSVQGHGSFPEEAMEDPIIQVTESPFEETVENQLEYYVNQLYEMDLFVAELVEYLDTLDEPTVLVLYGDHIPSLNIDASYYEDGDNYQTSYVFWANYGLEEVDQDLTTYQLLPMLLEQVNISEGVLTKFHQECMGDTDYLESLETLQYDLLYGERYVYDGVIYEPIDMRMGVYDMEITTKFDGEYVYITSSEITESSVVFINGKKIDSILSSSGTLSVESDIIHLGDEIVIKQISPDGTVLYESKEFIL